MNYYHYEGRILYFDKVVESHYRGNTYARSEKEARNNMAYQYKVRHNYPRNAKITLPDEIKTYLV